jgi:hypothetical protein
MRAEILHWLLQGTLKDNPKGQLGGLPNFPGAAGEVHRLAETGLVRRWHSGHTLRGDRRIDYRITTLGRERVAAELRRIDDERGLVR